MARSRSLVIAVTSASTTVVSWAEVCSDSTIRRAMSCRARDSRSVVPRSVDGSIALAGAAGAGAAAWLAGCPSAAGAAAAAAGCCSRCTRAASITSCFRIRPPTPVPATVARFTPCSAASLRTSGVMYGPSAVAGPASGSSGSG